MPLLESFQRKLGKVVEEDISLKKQIRRMLRQRKLIKDVFI